MGSEQKDRIEQDSNSWMTTYTDLMTLLLTFFVLLLSLSIIDKERKRLAINSLVGAFGFKPGAHSVIGAPKGANITLGSAPIVKEEAAFEELRNIALKNGLEKDIEAFREKERVVLLLGDRVLFKPGDARLSPEGAKILGEMAQVMKDRPCSIELRGYCAPSETVFEKDPLRSSMLISSRRALAVFDYLRREAGISSKQIVAHGFGIFQRASPSARRQALLGRQVEIILDYSQEIPFRMKKLEKKDTGVDYKGFLFRMPGDVRGD